MLHPRAWAYKAVRLAMGTVGRLSRGVRLGLLSGFASGQTLDYIYENRAQGFTPLGKLIDRIYLDGLGWRCIRVRRLHLETLILRACALVKGTPVRILDLAGGPGRYLLELYDKLPPGSQVTVRDLSEGSLEQGRKLAATRGLSQVSHERGNAFESSSLAELGEGTRDVVIFSGLY